MSVLKSQYDSSYESLFQIQVFSTFKFSSRWFVKRALSIVCPVWRVETFWPTYGKYIFQNISKDIRFSYLFKFVFFNIETNEILEESQRNLNIGIDAEIRLKKRNTQDGSEMDLNCGWEIILHYKDMIWLSLF